MLILALLACRADAPPKRVVDADSAADTGGDTAAAPFDSLCPSEGGVADELALWSVAGRALSLVTLDGAVVLEHTFFPTLGDDEAWYAGRADARGGVVVAAMDRYQSWAPRAVSEELLYVGPDGTWSVTAAGVYGGEVFLGADGSFAWDRGYLDFDAANEHLPGHLYAPDGAVRELLGWAIGAPVNGAVPVCTADACGWDDGSGALVEARAPSEWVRMVADRLVYPSAAGLVSEVPGDVRVLLDGVGASLVLDAGEGDWLLVNDGARRWRVDVAAGTAEAVDVVLPDGRRAFDTDGICGTNTPWIDDRGEVLLPLRDDTSAAVWRLDRAGAWTRLGADVSDVVWLDGHARGGSYVLDAIGTQDTYCAQLPWGPPAAGALVGTSLQVVRPDDPAAVSLASTWSDVHATELSAGGRCALAADAEGSVVVDLTTGARASVPGAVGWLLER